MQQTYHNPLADLPFWFLNHAIASPRVTAFLMAAPAGVAWFAFLAMLPALFPAGPGRAVWIAGAFAIGITGSMGLSVIGSTMNEWPSAMLLVAAMAMVVVPLATGRSISFARIALAGALTGSAMGIKLTYGVFALAFVVAFASWNVRARWREIAVACAGAAAGFLLAYGFWGWTLWREFDNPFFPYFNHVFRSPWWEPIALFDRNFGPKDALQALAFPLFFARESPLVSEVAFRDWRLAALFVLAIACAVRWIASGRKPVAPAWRFLIVFATVAYVAWLKIFAIYRYLVPLEVVSGALIAGALLYLVPGTNARRAAIVIAALALIGTTRTASWGRIPFLGTHFDVAVPQVGHDALVIVGPWEPMAYIIPFFPADARFVSPHNNFLYFTQDNGLTRRIAEIVARHQGPIYSLDLQKEEGVDAVLLRYRLRRDTARCEGIRSNLDWNLMRLCPVERMR